MKKNRKKLSRILAMIVIFLLSVGANSFTSSARGLIDLTQKGEMTIVYKYDDAVPLQGMVVHAYRIASISANGEYTLLSPYSSFPVTDINKITSQNEWNTVIDAVEPYIYTNKVNDSATQTVDENGIAHFVGLDLGLYLVRSDPLETTFDNGKPCIYTVKTFLISVPSLDENDNWVNPVYAVVAKAKCERTKLPKNEEYILRKIWNDSGYTNNRPSSITVQIFRDGVLFNTVTLDADHNWQFKWTYEEGHNWTFAEQAVSGYTVRLIQNGREYTLENSYNPPDTPPPPPDNPPPPPETPPTTPPPGGVLGAIRDLPQVLGAVRQLPQVLGARRLPQTGQLWWPLPILVIAGIFFIVKGIKKNAKMKAQNN